MMMFRLLFSREVWLVPPVDLEIPMLCEECGSSDVETLAWVRPNENNKFVDYLGIDDNGNNWCHHCEEHTDIIQFTGDESCKPSSRN